MNKIIYGLMAFLLMAQGIVYANTQPSAQNVTVTTSTFSHCLNSGDVNAQQSFNDIDTCIGLDRMVYPAIGIANSTGSAWGNSYAITGSGNVALSNSPIFVTPNLGAALATSVNGLIVTPTAGTLTLPNNSSAVLATSGNYSLTLTATSATNVTLPTSGTLLNGTTGILATGATTGATSQAQAFTDGITCGAGTLCGYLTLSSANLYSPLNDTFTIGNTASTSYDTFTVNTGATGGETINGVPTAPGGIDSNTQLMLQLNNSVTDTSNNSATVTNHSTTFSNSSPKYPGTYYGVFNGTSSYLSVPNASWMNTLFSSDYTIDFWFESTTLPSNNTYTYLLSEVDSGDNNGYEIFYGNNSGSYYISASGYNGGPNISQITATVSLSLNTWNHLAWVKHGSTLTLYWNGTSVGTSSYSTFGTPSEPMGIGCQIYSSINGFSYANIQGLRVSNNARWTSNFTPATIPYVSATVDPKLTFSNNSSGIASLDVNSNTNIMTLTNNAVAAMTLSSTGAATFPVSGMTFATPFTLGATSVTSTGTQLNYLNAATGTTGTTSTNLVFSTSPTFITPTLGAAAATSLKTGLIFPSADSTTAVQIDKADGTTNVLDVDTTNGRVGIGLSSLNGGKLEILSTTEQLRLDYDATHYFNITVGSGGNATFGGTTGNITTAGTVATTNTTDTTSATTGSIQSSGGIGLAKSLWVGLNLLVQGNVNWDDLKNVSTNGINWNDNVMGSANFNWTDIRSINPTGLTVNYNPVNTVQATIQNGYGTATTLIDQSAQVGTNPIGGNGANTQQSFANSFTLASTSTITSLKIYFGANAGSPVGTITVSIQTISGSLPSGTLADSHLTNASWTVTPSATNTITFTGAAALPAGTYALTVSPNSTNVNGTSYRIEGNNNSYGTVYSGNAGTSWSPGGLNQTNLSFQIIGIAAAASNVPDVFDNNGNLVLGATSTALSGANNIEAAGTIQGDGNIVLKGTLTNTTSSSGIGWSVHTGANTACNTTCGTSACVFGFDTGLGGTDVVNCASALADTCVCAGP